MTTIYARDLKPGNLIQLSAGVVGEIETAGPCGNHFITGGIPPKTAIAIKITLKAGPDLLLYPREKVEVIPRH